MNADEVSSLVRSLANTFLTTGAITAYVNGQQAAALASGAGALAFVLWGVYSRWNMRQVRETAVVTATAPTVAIAKAQSIPAGK